MRFILLGLIALGAGWAAAAQPSAPPPEPERIELGRRLAAAGDFSAITRALGEAEIERQAHEAPGLSDSEREALRDTGRRVLAAARERLLARLAPIYASRFDVEQLRALVAFFEGPIGRAYTGALPMLLPEIAVTAGEVDLGAEIRAQYCRETGRLCAEAPR